MFRFIAFLESPMLLLWFAKEGLSQDRILFDVLLAWRPECYIVPFHGQYRIDNCAQESLSDHMLVSFISSFAFFVISP